MNALKPFKILFVGADKFAVPSLFAVAREFPKELLGVVSQPDQPAGRGRSIKPPLIIQTAADLKIPFWQPENQKELSLILDNLKPDLVIITAYGRIISHSLLAKVPFGWLNVHPSLLPRHRGPSPITGAILAGDKKTGVSFMLIDEKTDHGPLLGQIFLALSGNETNETLSQTLAELAANHLPGIIRQYLAGQIKPKEQNHSLASQTALLKREDGAIHWKKDTAQEIDKKIRAFYPWPGAFCILPNGQRLKILSGLIKKTDKECPTANNLFCDKEGLFFTCAKGTVYQALTVQKEGKRPVTGKEFCAGYRNIISNSKK